MSKPLSALPKFMLIGGLFVLAVVYGLIGSACGLIWIATKIGSIATWAIGMFLVGAFMGFCAWKSDSNEKGG